MDSIIPQETPQKQCKGPCGQFLPATLEFFHAQAKGKLQPMCKMCRSEQRKQHRQDNIEQYHAYEQSHLEKHREDSKRSYAKHKERLRAERWEKHPPQLLIVDGKKRCTQCNEWKPATSENFHARRGNRWRPECKECRKKYSLLHSDAKRHYYYSRAEHWRQYSRMYYRMHREQRRQVARNYHRTHTEQRKQYMQAYRQSHSGEMKQTQRRYNEIHSEQRRQYNRDYHAKHLAKRQTQIRAYQKNHPEVVRIINANRRARQLNAQGRHTLQQIREQLQRQCHKCYYCQIPFRQRVRTNGHIKYLYHIDHIVPLSRGGSNDMSNIVLACPFCNMSKGRKLLHEWFQGGRLL